MNRVLLDASDIINILEHSRPTVEALESSLHSRNATLVLTFTNVLEFVRPILDDGDFLRFRPLLQRLERLPIRYLRNAHIPMQELKGAVEAFLSGAEYQAIDPYVRRWEETAQLPGMSVCEMLVDLRIDEAVYMIWKTNPEAIRGPAKAAARLRALVVADRRLVRANPVRPAKNFVNAVGRYLQRSVLYDFACPENRIQELAEWVYSDPRRCPGLRLHYDLYHQMLSDVQDTPKDSDLCDHSHASCLPYVEEISLDRRMAHHLRQVCRRLERITHGLGYSDRIRAGVGVPLPRGVRRRKLKSG